MHKEISAALGIAAPPLLAEVTPAGGQNSAAGPAAATSDQPTAWQHARTRGLDRNPMQCDFFCPGTWPATVERGIPELNERVARMNFLSKPDGHDF